MTDLYRDLPFPRTEPAEKALRFTEQIEDRAIFNPSMRTYLYGRFVGEQEGRQPGRGAGFDLSAGPDALPV